jgi:acetoin utilization deacetylase AcuC-like enzyme
MLDHGIDRRTRECPERLARIDLAISSPGQTRDFVKYAPRRVTDEELFAVHSRFYIEQVAGCCVRDDPYCYDSDTYLMEDSLPVARLAAGGCLVLADAIMLDEIGRGFALIRPPGHHAEAGRGLGFCIINNVAVTAQYLVDRYDLERILILDFDAHHGNGTQQLFYESSKILFISIHQRSIFPFSGDVTELGQGAGAGFNVNIPVFSQYGDAEYEYLMGKLVLNIAEQFRPQIFLVSAGFDAHAHDSMSGLALSTAGFVEICELLKHSADQLCGGRLLYVLEGGYNLPSLTEAVLASMDSLMEPSCEPPKCGLSRRAHTLIESTLSGVLSDKWTI